MGRNAQPIDMLAAKGKKHLTKQEIEDRKAAEIKLGASDLDKLKPPVFVKNDVIAYKHWKQHIKEYKAAAAQGIEVISSTDVGMLAIYCKTYSEYENLLKVRQRVEAANCSEELESHLDASTELNDKLVKMIQDALSTDGLLRLETAINKKMDMLIKMQDRLFLNPLAKVKNVPKREQEKPKNPLEKAGFNL